MWYNEYIGNIKGFLKMSETILICTNNSELAEVFSIQNIETNKSLNVMIENNIQKISGSDIEGERGLSLLKTALTGFGRKDLLFFKMTGKNIAGAIVIGYNPSGWSFVKEYQYAIRSVSVAEKHQGKGVASILIREVFKFFEKNNIPVLKQSSYTKEGKLKIKHVFERISKEYNNVKFVDL